MVIPMQTNESPHIPRSELYPAAAIVGYGLLTVTVPLVLHDMGLISLSTMMNMPLLLWSAAAIIAGMYQFCSGMVSAGDQE